MVLGYGVDKDADAVDADANFIFACQREGVGWNDAGAGQQEASVREGLIAEEVFDESLGVALHLGQSGRR